MTDSSISVAWRDRPFDGACHRRLVPFEGRPPTIAEAIKCVPGLPEEFLLAGEARLNGELVPREWWGKVRPRSTRDSCITLHMRLLGGGGGGSDGKAKKNPLATVATIGVLLAAAAFTGGLGDVIGLSSLGVSFAGGTVGAAVLGAAVGIGGALAVAAMFKPPSLATNNQQPVAANTISPIPDTPASLSGNVLSPGAAVPRVLGTMRVFPPFLTPQLVELVSGIEYAETVMGLSGPHDLSQIQVDGVDISSVPEASIEIQTGVNRSIVQGLVARQGFTLSPGLTLSQHQFDPTSADHQLYLNPTIPTSLAVPQWHRFVTRVGPDELWLHLNFDGGIAITSAIAAMNVPFRIQMRQVGTSAWVNLPEIHYQRMPGSGLQPFKTEIRLKFQKPPAFASAVGTTLNNGWSLAFKAVPGQVLAPATSGWTADPYFSQGAGNDLLSVNARFGGASASNVINVDITPDNAIFYLDPDIFGPVQYEFQIRRGQVYPSGNFNPVNYTTVGSVVGPSATLLDLFEYVYANTSEGVGASATATDQANTTSTCVLERVVSVWNQNPIQSADFATISLRVYRRQLQNISVLASGFVNDWDGAGWNTVTTTSSPAAHYRDVLAGVLGTIQLPSPVIDDTGLVAWRSACASLGYEVNAVVEGKTYVDVLLLIASCGYARPRASETWGVIRDYDRTAEAPVQIFTPRNSANLTWTKPFVSIPTGFRISFYDKDLDYAQNNIIIFVDETAQDATNLETMSYDGLVTEGEIMKRAAYDLQQAKSRFTFYSLDADIESIVCQRGDLVGVQSDILDSMAGYARVAEVVTDVTGLVTGLMLEGTTTIDGEVGLFSVAHVFNLAHVFTAGARTGVAIRLKGGSGILLKEVTASTSDEVSTVSFVTPFADPGIASLDKDCMCAFGPLGSEYRRMLIDGVSPKPNLMATISLVDEAPEVWSAKFGATPQGIAFISDDGATLLTTANT